VSAACRRRAIAVHAATSVTMTTSPRSHHRPPWDDDHQQRRGHQREPAAEAERRRRPNCPDKSNVTLAINAPAPERRRTIERRAAQVRGRQVGDDAFSTPSLNP
jgi:hypothetical protein